MHRSQLIPGRIVPQKNVSGASDNSKELSKSSVSSKCLTAEQSLQGQIVQLKQKAHQSFMQVIQMQQLHEEELEQLREEFNAKEQEFADREAQFMRKQEEFQRREEQFKQKEKEWQSRVHELEQKVKNLELTVRSGPDDPEGRAKEWEQLEVRVKQLQFENATLEKNYKHHICEFQQDDLQIDNIELITCREQSRLDDSAIINFTEIVNFHRPQEQLAVLKEETRKGVEALAGRPCAQTSLGPMLDRLFEYIALLRSELAKLQQKGTEKQKERESAQNKFYESLQKETKFMADHIKRLSAEKLKLEKRLQEMQRQNKAHEERLRKVDSSLARRGIKLSEVAPAPPEDHQKSLQINEFISQTFKNSSNNPTHKAQYGILRKTKN